MRGYSYLIVASVALYFPNSGQAFDEPASNRALTGIQQTQMTMRLGSKQFQATVVAKTEDTVTVVTAAHCLSPQDVGSPIAMIQAGRQFGGRLLRAAQNPDYRPVASRDPQSKTVRSVLSVDNAVATIEIRPGDDRTKEALRNLRPAELTASPVPEGSSQTVIVHILDQLGQEHVVKAGNHLNPKCLAWGNTSYHPVPGDSGAGVFLIRPDADGKTTSLLIGNVALSDNRGGIAPLVSRKSRWIDEALIAAGPLTKSAQNRPAPP